MMVCSLLLHLALVLVVVFFRLYPEAHPLAETTYYVEMVSLPVASPAKGNPNPAPAATEQKPAAPEAMPAPPRPAPAQAAPPPSRSTMTYPTAKAKPAPSNKKQAETSAKNQLAPSTAEAKAFQERMAKLERKAEDQRQAAVLARLRKGIGGKKGSPTGTGTQAGVDYAAYIQSRLRDAFVDTIAYQSKTPQVTVRLVIGPDGRIALYRKEKSTGDTMFEDSVDRAIHIAERTFRKPPGGAPFEQGFVFRPQGVGLK